MNITKTFVDTTNMLKLYILNYIKIILEEICLVNMADFIVNC